MDAIMGQVGDGLGVAADVAKALAESSSDPNIKAAAEKVAQGLGCA
jgi:hypothetical protein